MQILIYLILFFGKVFYWWKGQGEAASFSEGAGYADVSAEFFNDGFGDSQTQAGSFGAFAVSRITEKGFENAVYVFFGDAAAVIFEGDDDTVFFVLGDFDFHIASVVHRFNGIEYQIYGNHFEICGIAEDGQIRRSRFKRNADAFAFGLKVQQADNILQGTAAVDVLGVVWVGMGRLSKRSGTAMQSTSSL